MIKSWWFATRFLFCKLFGKYYFAKKCGHKTKSMAKFNIFGEEFFIVIYTREYCSHCLAKMSIRCAWCGKAINVGDPITLNTPGKKSFQIPKYTIGYGETYPTQLIGCLRDNCGDALYMAGFWEIPGEVFRILSQAEIALSIRDCFIIGNPTNQNQKVLL